MSELGSRLLALSHQAEEVLVTSTGFRADVNVGLMRVELTITRELSPEEVVAKTLVQGGYSWERAENIVHMITDAGITMSRTKQGTT